MKKVFCSLSTLALLLLTACSDPLEEVALTKPVFDDPTVQRLVAAEALNIKDVIARKGLLADEGAPAGFLTANPYIPVKPLSAQACAATGPCRYRQGDRDQEADFPGRPAVYDWWQSRKLEALQAEVCGLSFTDSSRNAYTLKTFPGLAALQADPDYQPTHYQACGTCSSLQDLAIYGAKDLTRMASVCTRRGSLSAQKACMLEIGFSEPCAETWAYNAAHTRRHCAMTCLREYGWRALLPGGDIAAPTDTAGELNACLLCDEMLSGPGFQFAAGRIRRNSGIISEIERPDDQVYTLDHSYFD